MSEYRVEKQVREKELVEVFSPEACFARKCAVLKSYFIEANKTTNLEKKNRELVEQNDAYQKIIDSLMIMIRDLVNPNYPAMEFLRNKLAEISKAMQAYSFVSNNVINFWILIEEEDFETEIRIADGLRELMNTFRNLRFDFMVIPKSGPNLGEFMPLNSRLIFSRS